MGRALGELERSRDPWPTKMRRPHIPLKVQLDAALYQLGLDPKTAVLDHHPPLAMRVVRGYAYLDPPANDPRYLQWMDPLAHLEKTTGRRGTSKLSKRGGDLSEIAKTKRLEKTRIAFIQKILDGGRKAVDKPKRKWPKRRIQSRPMRHAKSKS